MTQVYRQPKTYFIDIDGTLIFHMENFHEVLHTDHIPPLKDASKKTAEWHCQGHTIILTTARSESMRDLTMKQLANVGITYDQLIMGLTSGVRVLVNDYNPDTCNFKAEARNVRRNIDGLSNID